jgi:hypothetical protein
VGVGDDASAPHGMPGIGEPFPEEDLVRSPGGWLSPAGCRPGWDWVPPSGAQPEPQLMAWWIRALYRTPFLDRYAHRLMWERGGFLVLPPGHRWVQRIR